MIFRFMDANKADFPIRFMASRLGVSTSGFYEWRYRQANPSRRTRSDVELTKTICEIHTRSRSTDAKIFSSFPGAGPVVAACLLAEIGEDRNRFPTPQVLLAEAGLAPVTRSSGKVTRVRFRYAPNRRLRDVFTWWGMTQIRIDPWSRARYQTVRDRGHRYYRALRSINTSWARVLWACWTNNTPYNAELHASRNMA